MPRGRGENGRLQKPSTHNACTVNRLVSIHTAAETAPHVWGPVFPPARVIATQPPLVLCWHVVPSIASRFHGVREHGKEFARGVPGAPDMLPPGPALGRPPPDIGTRAYTRASSVMGDGKKHAKLFHLGFVVRTQACNYHMSQNDTLRDI